MSMRIHLDGGTSFEPGAEVRGRAEWQAGDEAPRSVLISLLWHTEGKGTEDIEIVEQIELEHPPASGSRDLTFRLPDFPWSFSGALISLVWAIEASLEPGGTVERVDLISAPGAEEIRL
ncbi:MAG: hypothetical protein GY719_00975 [bacterium]|nr:hypothetical protein [bacterium]